MARVQVKDMWSYHAGVLLLNLSVGSFDIEIVSGAQVA